MSESQGQVERVMKSVMKPRISALLMSAVEEVRTMTGQPPTPEEVVWLHALCEKQVLPDVDDAPKYLPQPLELGPLTLYPLTLEAQMWLDEYVRKWWPNDDLPAVAYAMAHSNHELDSPFPALVHRAAATLKVYGWWWVQRVSRALVLWGVMRLAGRQEIVQLDATHLAKKEVDDASPLDWGVILSKLCATYHLSPSTFLHMTTEVVLDMYRNIPRVAKEQGSYAGMMDVGDPLKEQAFAHFRLVIRYIVLLRQAEAVMRTAEQVTTEIETLLANKEQADG